VVKFGGNAMTDDALKAGFARDVALLKLVGMNPVVVHGGGPQIEQMLAKLGKKAEFIQGMRVTDAETMEVVEWVLAGEVQQDIVGLINQAGGKAVGLTGRDGGMIRAQKLKMVDNADPNKHHDVGQVGDIVSIDCGVVLDGYYGDAAITVAVGEKITPTAQKLLQVTEASLARAIEKVRIGNTVGDVGAAVQEVVEANGFSVVRDFVGHGIGTRLHEDPQVPNFGTPGHGARLREGMVLAIEPMVNAGKPGARVLADNWTAVTEDGSISAHFEHCVAVTKDGPLVLTA